MAQGNDARMTKWSFWAGITFIALLAMLHVIKSEIEPSWNFISEYQVGRFGWLMSIAFISLGSSCLFLGISLWNEVNLMGKIGIVMMLFSSVGMFVAAIFKTDPLNTSPELVTRSGMLHQWGAMLDQIPFAALFVTIALFRKKEWHVNRMLLIVSLIFVWFGMIYFIASIRIHFPADGKFGPDVLVGWQNRIMIVSQALWVILVAYEANRQKKQNVIFA